MKRNGATVLVGMPPAGVKATFDPGWLAANGQRILGSKMGSARLPVDVPKIVELHAQGRLKLDELISARYPLESDQRSDRLLARRRGAAECHRVLKEVALRPIRSQGRQNTSWHGLSRPSTPAATNLEGFRYFHDRPDQRTALVEPHGSPGQARP